MLRRRENEILMLNPRKEASTEGLLNGCPHIVVTFREIQHQPFARVVTLSY